MQAISPTSSPASTPSKSISSGSSHPNGGVGGGDHHHHHHGISTSSSPSSSHSRGLPKRLHALSFSKLKHVHAKTGSEAGSRGGGGKGGAGGVAGSVAPAQSDGDSASPVHSLDLEREEFPGGDAMLEVLTRLQTYQENMQMQLQVSKRMRTCIVRFCGLNTVLNLIECMKKK